METRTLLLSIFLLAIMELKTVSSRTPASTAPLTSAAVTLMAPTESNLELGVGIDPSLREFAVGNQISARGVRLPHYKSASARKSICENRDAISMGFSLATKLCVRSLRFQSYQTKYFRRLDFFFRECRR